MHYGDKKMPQESVNDEQLNSFIKSAKPADGPEGKSGEIKDDLLGSKSRFQFTCQSCGKTTVTSEKSYANEEGRLMRNARYSASYEIGRQLRHYLYKIPYIGTVLARSVPYPSFDNSSAENKGRSMAFEEVKEHFHKCNDCGQYVCSKCYRNGKCIQCSDS